MFKKLLLGLLIITMVPLIANCGEENRGYLGVSTIDIDEASVEGIEITDVERGALIVKVHEGTPAEKAGFERGDVILSIDGVKIEDQKSFLDIMGKSKEGQEVVIEFMHKNKIGKVDVKFGKYPYHKFLSKNIIIPRIRTIGKDKDAWVFAGFGGHHSIGFKLQDMDKDLGEYFDAKEGVLIVKVYDNTPAAKVGFKSGDILLSMNDKNIKSVEEFNDYFTDEILEKEAKEIKITTSRKGKETTKTLDVSDLNLLNTFNIDIDEIDPVKIKIDANRNARKAVRKIISNTDKYIHKDFTKEIEENIKQQEEKLKKLEERLKELEKELQKKEKELKNMM